MVDFVIRHAQSRHNINETNNLDSPITANGIVQARAVGGFLKNHLNNEFTIYTSPFLRCLMTIEQILEGAKGALDKIPVVVQPLIGESLPPDSSVVVVPRRDLQFLHYNWSNMDSAIEVGPDDGRKLIQRCMEAVDGKERGVYISHGSTCLAIISALSDENPSWQDWDYSISNASISRVENKKVIWHGRVIHVGDFAEASKYENCSRKYERIF